MIKITGIRLRPDHSPQDLKDRIQKILRLPDQAFRFQILRQSVDAHRRPEIWFVYTAAVSVKNEKEILRRCRKDASVSAWDDSIYAFPFRKYTDRVSSENQSEDSRSLDGRPVVVGAGPAGLFCALMLAEAGLCPVVLERGERIEDRLPRVERFWTENLLSEESNVQFGEGGAGTFSDGKLNTMIKDRDGIIRYVMKTFVRFGAPEDILFSYKPHIGTDRLRKVVKAMREQIISLGGTFLFRTCLLDIMPDPDSSRGSSANLTLAVSHSCRQIRTNAVVLCIGHSARDTFEMLLSRGFRMSPKAFACGIRIIHPQEIIDDALYGKDCPYDLGPAPYKLTHRCRDGRGVYSFCMCPGGYVVNASSQKGQIAVNGMSYHDRGGRYANSAIVVTVSPSDYGGTDALSGVRFQQNLERGAYQAGEGSIPVQRFGDFLENRASRDLPDAGDRIRGWYTGARIRQIFPAYLSDALEEGIRAFSGPIPGFDSPDTLLCASESRTSSPVRIERKEDRQAPGHPGVFPCGEGAGYAGGITSAAADGIRTANAVCEYLTAMHGA